MTITTDDAVTIVKFATAVIAGIGLAVKGFGWWNTKKNPEKSAELQRIRDGAEASFLENLVEQARRDRERAEKAEGERNEAIRQIGRLEGEIAGLSSELKMIKMQQYTNIRLLRDQAEAISKLRLMLIKAGVVSTEILEIGIEHVGHSDGG